MILSVHVGEVGQSFLAFIGNGERRVCDAWPTDWFFWDIYIQVREGRMPGKNVEVENSDASISEVMLIVQVYVLLT